MSPYGDIINVARHGKRVVGLQDTEVPNLLYRLQMVSPTHTVINRHPGTVRIDCPPALRSICLGLCLG